MNTDNWNSQFVLSVNPGFRMHAKYYYYNANAPADLKSVICLLLCVTVRARCSVPLAVVVAPHRHAVGASSTTTTQTKRNALNSMGKLGLFEPRLLQNGGDFGQMT